MRADSQTALANNLYFTSLGAVTLDFMDASSVQQCE